MLTLSSLTTEHIINAYLYLSFYNLSLLVLFWVILSVQNKEILTLYSFNRFRYSNFYIIVLTVTLFSIAGIPPFMGFFSKVLVITALLKSHYVVLYWLLLPLLLLTLYFYVQNIRFLYTTTLPSIKYPYLFNERLSLLFIYTLVISLNYQVIGFIWFDKFLLFFHW